MPKCVCVVYDVWCVYMCVVLVVVFFPVFRVLCSVCMCGVCVFYVCCVCFVLCVGEKLGFLGTEPRPLSGKGPSLLLY